MRRHNNLPCGGEDRGRAEIPPAQWRVSLRPLSIKQFSQEEEHSLSYLHLHQMTDASSINYSH